MKAICFVWIMFPFVSWWMGLDLATQFGDACIRQHNGNSCFYFFTEMLSGRIYGRNRTDLCVDDWRYLLFEGYAVPCTRLHFPLCNCLSSYLLIYWSLTTDYPASSLMVKQKRLRRSDVDVAGSNPPIVSQLLNLAILCRPRSPSEKWCALWFH